MSLIRILGRAIVHGVAGEIDKAQSRKIEKRKNTICCADCATVVDPNSVACHSCGSQSFCSEYDLVIKKKDEQEQAKIEAQSNMAITMQDQMITAHERQRERDYKARKKALRTGLVCPICNTLYESTHKFCPACASQTAKLDEETIESFLHDEFPEQYNEDR